MVFQLGFSSDIAGNSVFTPDLHDSFQSEENQMV